jgi:hypothetical protein
MTFWIFLVPISGTYHLTPGNQDSTGNQDSNHRVSLAGGSGVSYG